MKSLRNLCILAGIALLITSCAPEEPGAVTLNGEEMNFINSGIGWSASVGDDYEIAYTSSFYTGSGLYPNLSIELGDHIYSSYSQTNFFNFFTAGPWPFATDTSAGFTLAYQHESSSDPYSSLPGPQTGSSVNFTSFTPQPGSGFTPDRVAFVVTFNCTLYNLLDTSQTTMISGNLGGVFEKY